MNKKICLIVSIIMFIFFCSCKKEIIVINDVEEYDMLLVDAIKYDIRCESDCEKGHIKGFMCMGEMQNKEIVNTISSLYKKDKKITLIGDYNDIKEIFNQLQKIGYSYLFYLEGGIDYYIEVKGLDNIETGCGC